MTIITRFAPSPTGYLHIGSARTAIFNYLFARHFGGKFLLRVEDTDKLRSTKESLDTIISGMNWLGIDYDGEIIYQSENIQRHIEVADILLKKGLAYKCFLDQSEIDEQRKIAQANSKSFLLNSPWRDVPDSEHPADSKYVVRIKAPKNGHTIINDLVQGEVKVSHDILDDLVLLRSDGTPTYMLSVVVDDHDMGITHVIRGDDHLNNAFRQKIIYDCLGWNFPKMAHIPLIHGDDGAKLSKRHGALGVDEYKNMGYLPNAIFNYLLDLGWSGANGELVTKNDAIKLFDGTKIGKSPSRLDFEKLKSVNSKYLKNENNEVLTNFCIEDLERKNIKVSDKFKQIIFHAMDDIKMRSDITLDLSSIAIIYHEDDIYNINDEASKIIKEIDDGFIERIIEFLNHIDDSNHEIVMSQFKELAKTLDMKLGKLIAPIRAVITGTNASPSVFSIISILGKDKIIHRLKNYKNKI